MASKQRLASAIGIILILVMIFSPLFGGTQKASADQITLRSLTLQAGTSDGGSKPGGTVNHFFAFTLPNIASANIGSIQFQYCTLAAGTCNTPLGLDTTGATMGTQSGATSFTLNATTNGAPYITRTAASIAPGTAVTYQLLSVINPNGTSCLVANGFPINTSPNCTFYVRISTFTSTTATGSPIDTGTVAASTNTQIVIQGIMPESLVFCTGATVGTTSGVPDCATATAGLIYFNQLFSPTDTATTTSQMAASTNAGHGYIITVNGVTLTSGSNTISALGSATASIKGLSQFGLNLRANTTATSTVAVGTDVAPVFNGTNYNGEPAPLSGYQTVDSFKFVTGNTVADSNSTGTDAQIFTVTYIVNVPGSQPAGTYTTTLTYICTPTF